MKLALNQARYVRGVKTVVNDLKIGSSRELAMTALNSLRPGAGSSPAGPERSG